MQKMCNGCSTLSESDDILTSDVACDQSTVTDAWTVTKTIGGCVIMTDAFTGRNTGLAFPVVSAICKQSWWKQFQKDIDTRRDFIERFVNMTWWEWLDRSHPAHWKWSL